MSKKMDPELRAILRSVDRDRRAEVPIESQDTEESNGRTGYNESVIVEFNGDIKDLTDVGFESHTIIQHPTKGYNIATGVLSQHKLRALNEIAHVVRIEGPKRTYLELNYSLPEIQATAVHSGKPPRMGNGIVIGIIDAGFDWRHGSFVGDDGKSRILAIWDQTEKRRSAGEEKAPEDVGAVYPKKQIDRALKEYGKDSIYINDDTGHGTHVAGIAAGNGKPASCCEESGTYVGVAPNADLILVKTSRDDIGLIRAINFISNRSATKNQPAVINYSMGGNIGPHDGTSLTERAIDAYVATGDAIGCPLIVVNSAGNNGKELLHVDGIVSGNSNVDIVFTVGKGQEQPLTLDLWYARAATLNLTVTTPDETTSGPVNHGTDTNFVINPAADVLLQASVDIGGEINALFDRDNNFRICIRPVEGKGVLPYGRWRLNLANPNATAVPFHCWIADPTTCSFLPPTNPPDDKIRANFDSTLTIPGTSAEVITVANHESRTNWCDCWPSTGIAPSSSRGPVTRGADTNRKPDIAAPGVRIMSAKADAANLRGNCCSCCPDACCCLYTDQAPKGGEFTGTSMAAPHVTGAIALLLEENPRLTRADIVRHLQATARDRPAGGWDNVFGAGKLNIEAAIQSVRKERSASASGHGERPHDAPMSEPDRELAARLDPPPPQQRHVPQPPQPLPPSMRILQTRLETLPEGANIIAAISRHFSEVRRLINTNRRIATMWHRADGPRLLRLLLHDPEHPNISASIQVSSGTRYLGRCFDLLARYGSPRLRESLKRYRTCLVALLEQSISTGRDGTIGRRA